MLPPSLTASLGFVILTGAFASPLSVDAGPSVCPRSMDTMAGTYVGFASVFNITGNLHSIVQQNGNTINVRLDDIKFGAYNGELDSMMSRMSQVPPRDAMSYVMGPCDTPESLTAAVNTMRYTTKHMTDIFEAYKKALDAPKSGDPVTPEEIQAFQVEVRTIVDKVDKLVNVTSDRILPYNSLLASQGMDDILAQWRAQVIKTAALLA
ncbi:hypothetical protein BDV93DRAFT_559403 [Ceratobasidium sp. AG-I]|nr:hypothetical protein BDV93DRAFT_559403 [Ceratobasidium sp. AG-I]